MMKIISIVLQAVFVVVGVAAGFWLKSAPAEHEVASVEGDAESTPPKTDKKETKASHGKGKDAKDENVSGYMKFGRQFIVPVMKDDKVSSLVIMDLNIQAPADVVESLYTQEPRLRDALLGRLLQLSTRGVFDSQLIEKENLDVIRTELVDAARREIGAEAQNVLILNITRQGV